MSLNTCSSGHDEICHEGSRCPVCDLISDHKDAIQSQDDEIKDLKSTIDQLESEIESLKEPLIIHAIAVREAEERKNK